ncbi:hypothetical protein GPLA_1692 [Paraglaciecola polaris LMG 21857]|uniref:Uncharacterized protein n=1 Tax=Paraglaciecola polaris LMG 21857 TaxID=1129793 RepID=K6Z8V6_9ALTE|nr:hypothetical protein GPLA_1692 [Paraglaciecola polaris LMG 21857]
MFSTTKVVICIDITLIFWQLFITFTLSYTFKKNPLLGSKIGKFTAFDVKYNQNTD